MSPRHRTPIRILCDLVAQPVARVRKRHSFFFSSGQMEGWMETRKDREYKQLFCWGMQTAERISLWGRKLCQGWSCCAIYLGACARACAFTGTLDLTQLVSISILLRQANEVGRPVHTG